MPLSPSSGIIYTSATAAAIAPVAVGVAGSSIVITKKQEMQEFLLRQQLPNIDDAKKLAEQSLRDFEMLQQEGRCDECDSDGNNNNNNNVKPTTTTITASSVSPSSSSGCPCCCPHLREIFPDQLDLTLTRAAVITSNNTATSPQTAGTAAATATGGGKKEDSSNNTNTTSCSSSSSWIVSNPVHALHLSSQLENDIITKSSSSGSNNNNNNNGPEAAEEPILFGEEQERLIAIQTEGFSTSWHPWIIREQEDDEPEQQAEEQEENITMTEANDVKEATTTTTTTAATASNQQQQQQSSTTTTEQQQQQQQQTEKTAAEVTAANNDKATETTTSFSQPTPAVAGSSSTAATTTTTSSSAVLLPPSPSDVQPKPPAEEEGVPPPKPTSNDSTTGAGATTTTTTTEGASITGGRATNTQPPVSVLSSTVAKPTQETATTEAAKNDPKPSSKEEVVAPTSTSSAAAAAGASAEVPTQKQQSSSTAKLPPTEQPPAKSGGTDDISGAVNQPPAVTSSSAVVSLPPPKSMPTTTKTTVATGKGGGGTNNVGLLPEDRYLSLQAEEEQIRILRKAMLGKRAVPKKKASSTASGGGNSNKKRKTAEPKTQTLSNLGAWKHLKESQNKATSSSDKPLSALEVEAWKERGESARISSDLFMQHYRESRQIFWKEYHHQQQKQAQIRKSRRKNKNNIHSLTQSELQPNHTFGVIRDDTTYDNDRNNNDDDVRSCRDCRCLSKSNSAKASGTNNNGIWPSNANVAPATGDDLFHCLECDYVGCGPSWAVPNSNEHIVQHMLLSNHRFAVSCGIEAKIYCFKCGEFVQHEIFVQEKERVDIVETFPWLGWKEHPVMRSFNALRFMRVLDQGIVWRGMSAEYPQFVPPFHVKAARLSLLRNALFEGNVSLTQSASPETRDFAIKQSRKGKKGRFRIPAPVGMYNLGSTCFMSAILQCLVHCLPVQRYFLRDVGHNYQSCQIYRENGVPPADGIRPGGVGTKKDKVCLGCELDKLMLQYFGSSNGIDMAPCLETDSKASCVAFKGEPLVTAEMLTAAWKCGGMSHLAGYEQRDAHEFLHGFLEILGKHIKQYRERVHHAICIPHPLNAIVPEPKESEQDVIKKLFEGTLRSVLVCNKCGNKRTQSEPFMSLSLPLSKEVQKLTAETSAKGSPSSSRGQLSVERCLKHFTMPEALADPVDCADCREKTLTTKQHCISKLPRVLCLHLKRFDAVLNRKIEDFVSFPAKDLNMGPYLPHWSEITRGQQTNDAPMAMPAINYDLFGTVNHFGNLQSGHYVANTLVDSQWYHSNDAHVSYAGTTGNGEMEVVNSEGAYLLFYIRK